MKNTGSLDLSNCILTQFDTNGDMVEGLSLLGIKGVQFGPIGLGEDDIGNLGIMITKANINTFIQKLGVEKPDMQIGVWLVPDKQIKVYAPYLIPQNIVKAAKTITGINDDIQQRQFEKILEQKQAKNGKIYKEVKKISPVRSRIASFITVDWQQINKAIGVQNKKQLNYVHHQIIKDIVDEVAKKKDVKILNKVQNNRSFIYNSDPNTKNWKWIAGDYIINQILKQ